MKRLLPFLAPLLLALSLHASEERRETVVVSVGTNAAQTTTNYLSKITGKINEVAVDLIGTGVTGDVAVVVMPELTTLATRPVYTNGAIVADTVVQPRVQCEDDAGAAISGVYDKIPLCNETLRVIWANGGATGITAKVVIKYEKGE